MMLWFVAIQPHPGLRPGQTMILGTVEVPWERVVYQGRSCLALRLDGVDHNTVASLRTWKHHLVLSAEALEVAPRLAPVPVVQAQAGGGGIAHLVALFMLARSRGWVEDEVAGTGVGGQPDQGRNPRTGLTLVELTLTAPPVDWPELRAAGRPPWESSAWTPPGPGWVRPGWPDPVLRPVPSSDPAIPSPILPPDTLDAPAPSAPEPEDHVDTDPVDADPEPPSTTDPAVDAGYPAESVEAARAVVREWHARLPAGKEPHPAAANYHLEKAGLPKCRPAPKAVAQLRALLNPTP